MSDYMASLRARVGNDLLVGAGDGDAVLDILADHGVPVIDHRHDEHTEPSDARGATGGCRR